MIHTLVCGDSTDDKRYNQYNDNQPVLADALVTDPPYNVNYKGRGKKTSKGIANDNLANDNFQFFLLRRDRAGIHKADPLKIFSNIVLQIGGR